MTLQEFINLHKVAVNYDNNGKTICMLSVENAEKACEIAEFNLAKELLNLTESSRIKALKRIVENEVNYITN